MRMWRKMWKTGSGGAKGRRRRSLSGRLLRKSSFVDVASGSGVGGDIGGGGAMRGECGVGVGRM